MRSKTSPIDEDELRCFGLARGGRSGATFLGRRRRGRSREAGQSKKSSFEAEAVAFPGEAGTEEVAERGDGQEVSEGQGEGRAVGSRRGGESRGSLGRARVLAERIVAAGAQVSGQVQQAGAAVFLERLRLVHGLQDEVQAYWDGFCDWYVDWVVAGNPGGATVMLDTRKKVQDAAARAKAAGKQSTAFNGWVKDQWNHKPRAATLGKV